MMKDSAASASATLSIPLHLPPPRLGTFTTATRKRYCGFALAVLALTMHLMLLVVRVYRWAFGAERFSWWAAERVAASLVAVCIFGFILRRPRFSLQERNLKCAIVLLIPILDALPPAGFSPVRLLLQATHLFAAALYAYALGMNGRSSSILACLKPYRFQMIPVVLHVPADSPTTAAAYPLPQLVQ